jgi:hypothetical protein
MLEMSNFFERVGRAVAAASPQLEGEGYTLTGGLLRRLAPHNDWGAVIFILRGARPGHGGLVCK